MNLCLISVVGMALVIADANKPTLSELQKIERLIATVE